MDLPHDKSREEILSIHLKKRKRDTELFDIPQLSRLTEGFSGAELEHVIVEGLFSAFNESRELNTDDIIKAIKETIPLSTTYSEELTRIRDWARTRARNADVLPNRMATTHSRMEKLGS